MARNDAFLKLLIANGLLTEDAVRKLHADLKGDAFAILTHLAYRAGAPRDTLGKLWGDSIAVAHVNLGKTLFQELAVQRLPKKFATEQKVIPLYQLANTLTIATATPTDQRLLSEAAREAGMAVSPVFSFPDDIDYAIEVNYQSQNGLDELIGKLGLNNLLSATGTITEEQIKKLAGEQGIIDLVNGILLLALKERASDIHIDPWEDRVKIRYRIDGVLQDRLALAPLLLPPLVSRIKIVSGMNITERRKPQDGRLALKFANREIDFRISTVPTIYGEKTVLRVLGQMNAKEIPSLEDLSLSATNLATLRRIIEVPNGVFFVTGPTGSGKTTTLYAVLKHLNKTGINIMTVEDPVEYRLAGVNQIQVNHAIDLDFASALRSFLRQDPDVILLGEIRDAETAKIAAQAALTGHLVVVTMHTNNAVQAVTRLVEIGVEPFLVAPSIIGVLAQRLVRKICDHCRESYQPERQVMDRLFDWDGATEVSFFRGKGCTECHQTGYSGRVAIHELFILDDEVRSMVSRNASILDIQSCAIRSGFKNMHYDGIKKVLRGITTLEEVERVVVREG